MPQSVRGPAADEAVTSEGTELRASCAAALDDMELSQDLGQASSLEVTVPSHATGVEDCADYAWARAVITTAALVSTQWAGPESRSAWDCNHSSLEYGVYRSRAGRWEFTGGALAFGNLTPEGACAYSVGNFPQQPGSDVTLVTAAREQSPTEVRIGLRAWSHNDTALGHAGTDCGSSSCYWPVRLRWKSY